MCQGLSYRKKVFIGLSGGVDSSVSALLLKEAGYDVTGVFIKVWSPDFMECTWKDDRLDAMRVSAKLGIPFLTIDLEKEYKKEVVDYMVREYKVGRTPNPDVFCNKHIKFGAFYNWAIKQGADFVATGHYARIAKRKTQNTRRQTLHATRYTLQTSLDHDKDQSYFLWQIKEKQLSHILFPVGGMKKTEVRALAKKHGLITADKKDSQGLCFVGKVDMKEFLSNFIPLKRGNVLDESGEIIGEHNGAFLFTTGERHGFTIHKNIDSKKMPFYVLEKDMRKNTITVGHRNPENIISTARKEVIISDANLFFSGEYNKSSTLKARLRYRQPLEKCTLRKIDNKRFKLTFGTPQIATLGQSAVIYDGDKVVGGGIITE